MKWDYFTTNWKRKKAENGGERERIDQHFRD